MFFIHCPHCNQMIEVIELNCRIFRCGVEKQNMTQINPHLCKEACEQLVLQNKIYGCGKPFKIDVIEKKNDGKIEVEYKASICGYV